MSEQIELDNDEMKELILLIHQASLLQLQEIQKHVAHEIMLAQNDLDPDHESLDDDEFFCDECGRISKVPYETAAGDYVCLDCHTKGPDEPDPDDWDGDTWGDPEEDEDDVPVQD